MCFYSKIFIKLQTTESGEQWFDVGFMQFPKISWLQNFRIFAFDERFNMKSFEIKLNLRLIFHSQHAMLGKGHEHESQPTTR